jgi:hypothetical protein
MQTRQAQIELTAFTLNLDKVTIPAKAVLHDFRQVRDNALNYGESAELGCALYTSAGVEFNIMVSGL